MSMGFEIRNGEGAVMLTPDDYSLNVVMAGEITVPAETHPTQPGEVIVSCPGMVADSDRWALVLPRQIVGYKVTAGSTVYLLCANSMYAIQFEDWVVDVAIVGEKLTDAFRLRNYYYQPATCRYFVTRLGA